MTYELAKKLEDAGFPYSEYGQRHFPCPVENCKGVIETRRDRVIETGTGKTAPIPTLSELIEACGNRFGVLNTRIGSEDSCPHWEGDWHCGSSGEHLIHVYGETPEEAVANLWLELHDRKS